MYNIMNTLFTTAINSIYDEFRHKFILAQRSKDKLTMSPIKFLKLWNIVFSSGPTKDMVDNEEDFEKLDALYANIWEEFDFEFANMSNEDKYWAGFEVASCIIKDDNFKQLKYDENNNVFL